MPRVIDYRDHVEVVPTIISGSQRGGIVQETNSGALILATAQDGNPRLYRSTDAGASWTLRATMTVATVGVVMRGAFVDSRGHIYMGGGTTDCLWSTYGQAVGGKFLFAELWKSSDDGLTWRKVCTGEAGAFWHLGEDSAGRIYVNEYSVLKSAGANGPTWPADYGSIPDEYPAVNVWRSDATGEVFSKWYSAPKPTGAGLRDGTRHIHAVYVDRADRAYVACGDYSAGDANLRWAGVAGKVLRLDAAGAVATDYGQFGNGSTSFIDTPGGTVLVGKDNDPSGIDALHPTLPLACQACNMSLDFGQRFGTYVFDLWRSADGVIFGNGNLSSRYSGVLFSTDEGATWGLLDIGNLQPVTMTHNPAAPSGQAFLSGGTIRRIKCPSKTELRWRKPWHVPP